MEYPLGKNQLISTTIPDAEIKSMNEPSDLKTNTPHQSETRTIATEENEVAFLMSNMTIEEEFTNILDDDDESAEISSKGTSELKEYLIAKQNLSYLQDMTNEQEQNIDNYPK